MYQNLKDKEDYLKWVKSQIECNQTVHLLWDVQKDMEKFDKKAADLFGTALNGVEDLIKYLKERSEQ